MEQKLLSIPNNLAKFEKYCNIILNNIEGVFMKKSIVSLFLTLSTVSLIAGGDIYPSKATTNSNPCNIDLTFVEKDVNLMWQDEAYTDKEDGAYSRRYNSGKAGTWSHAKRYCSKLDYAGYIDWRLPTSDELQNMHRINDQIFQNFRSSNFWSSTPTTAGKYYVVNTADAYRYKRKSKETNYIRCVRCTRPF